MSEGAAPVADPEGGPEGLQRERTVLAWNRTGIAMIAVGLLLGRFAAANPFSVLASPALVGVGGGIWVLWVTSFRPGGLDGASNRLRRRRTTAITIIALVLQAASLVLVLSGVHPPHPSETRPDAAGEEAG